MRKKLSPERLIKIPKSFLPRLITVLIVAPLALLAILYLTRELRLWSWLFAIYCGVFFAILWEWCDIARINAVWAKCLYAGLFILIAVVLTYYVDEVKLDDYVVGAALVVWTFGIVAVLFFKSLRRVLSNRTLLLPAGGIVAVGSILAFSKIDASGYALIAVIAVAGATDSLAYLIGNFFGTRKLHSDVSPSKTWEGTIGGFVGGLSCLFVFDQILNWIEFQTVWLWPIVVLYAIFGDLFESALKRTAGMKDSGNLLPGHGGFLDRLDSHMALSV
ncbi:MAG: hypothetical protein F4W92_06125, partial [Gammaproteobacteria bacterium]|nr:hypothetical protein [Gammaproteobacteria bacterium]